MAPKQKGILLHSMKKAGFSEQDVRKYFKVSNMNFSLTY